jgi:hypothetical protein
MHGPLNVKVATVHMYQTTQYNMAEDNHDNVGYLSKTRTEYLFLIWTIDQ